MAKIIFNLQGQTIKSGCEELVVAGRGIVFYSQYIT